MPQITRRRLFRMVIPRYPSFNVFSMVADRTTALGPLCVATCISKLPGWDVEVIDENNYRFPGPRDRGGLPDHALLQQLRPADAAGFYGALSCTIPRLFALARFYRQAGALTLGGGQHLDALPDEALHNGLDVVVHGEGEDAACEVLGAWERQALLADVAGISFACAGAVVTTAARPPIADFSRLPLPDFGLLRYTRLEIYPVNRTRGCGANCEFCCVKGKARSAAPERLLAQISYLAETFGARRFFVVDDQFAQDRAETIRFCHLLREYRARMKLRLRLAVQIRLDCGHDEQLLQAMRGAGVWFVAIGMESPIGEELSAMGKRLHPEQMAQLTRRFQQHGFYIHGMFIFGYPLQRGQAFFMPARERVARFKRFFRQARLDFIQVLTPVPAPGTALRARLEQEGRVLDGAEIGWEYYDGNFPLIVPDAPLTPEDVHCAIRTLMGGFYGARRLWGVALHTLRFPLAMLPLVGLRARFAHWYRAWYNDIVGAGGYFIVRQWQRAFRLGAFAEKLSKARLQQG